ncbi:MAG: DUF4350 domain-containing protein [Actinomycetota bacterium]|nr:DUF4350 domain-containing protein [Actinomycetota bacterium]
MSEALPVARRVRRALIAAVAVIVGLNVMGFVLDEISGARQGPPSSSYTTSPEGLAAYADLLSDAGHPITRLRVPLSEQRPPSGATVVMLDPEFVSPQEAEALDEFVNAGGRLIAGGGEFPGWLDEIVLTRPFLSPGGEATVHVAASVPEVAGVDTVRTSGDAYWSDPGSTLPVLGTPASTAVSVESVGRGRVVLLADSAILHNELLGEADNAAFGLQAAGPASRPVLFVESIHGYVSTPDAGLAAIPDRWLWTLLGLLGATLVYMWARGRRLGPPEEPQRVLPPPRRDYVDAVGGILARTRDLTTVGETLQRGLLRRLTRRAGGATSEAEIERAAAAAELRDADVRLLRERAASEGDLQTLARAIATLERKQRRGSDG